MGQLQAQYRRQAAAELSRRFSVSGRLRMRLRYLLTGYRWNIVLAGLSTAKRAADIGIALPALLLTLPVWSAAWAISWRKQRALLGRTRKVGRYCVEFEELSFSAELGRIGSSAVVRRLPMLLNVLRGEMSFIGPRAAAPGELDPRERTVRRRYDVRPGMVCLWWIRRRANIAYDTEAGLDRQYVETHSAMRDLGIGLRAIPALLFGEGGTAAPDVLRMLGIRIMNLTMTESIEWMMAAFSGSRPSQVCFVNPDCANIAYRDEAYRELLCRAELTLADGIGLKIAAKLLGSGIKQNVNGTDLFPRLMEAMALDGRSVYLLGARPGVPELVRDWIVTNQPGVRIAGVRHGYFTPEEEPQIVEEIRRSGADLLLVAFGAPRQDKWIADHLPELGVKVAMGVGGLFDFYSGRIPRAPIWMREIGMEWFYRFLQEPRRMWRRYFVGSGLFLIRVYRQRASLPSGNRSAAQP